MTTPCSQEKTMDRIEKKLDKTLEVVHSLDVRTTKIETKQEIYEEKIDKTLAVANNLDLRTTTIETKQLEQEKYVEKKSKANGTLWGFVTALTVVVFREILSRIL